MSPTVVDSSIKFMYSSFTALKGMRLELKELRIYLES